MGSQYRAQGAADPADSPRDKNEWLIHVLPLVKAYGGCERRCGAAVLDLLGLGGNLVHQRVEHAADDKGQLDADFSRQLFAGELLHVHERAQQVDGSDCNDGTDQFELEAGKVQLA